MKLTPFWNEMLTGSKVSDSSDEMPDQFEPPIIRDDICLMPGEPVVRIEIAPGNARRIFTGVDILSSVDAVWRVLTNYEKLHLVVPSLIKNEVLFRTVNGSRLLQVGGAKVLPGVTFTATTVLDVRTYEEDNPLPENMIADHLADTASSADVNAFSRKLPLARNIFPRPFAITTLPHRDITMQNVDGEGDFDFYQGIWRVQPLPSCAPDGSDACRLTYAVEIRPKGFLPVGLIEGRIASDLISNLKAIKSYVEGGNSIINESISVTPSLSSNNTEDTPLNNSTSMPSENINNIQNNPDISHVPMASEERSSSMHNIEEVPDINITSHINDKSFLESSVNTGKQPLKPLRTFIKRKITAIIPDWPSSLLDKAMTKLRTKVKTLEKELDEKSVR